MRIGLVTPYFYPLTGGVQEHVANLYLNFKSAGHEVKIITSSFLTKGPEIDFDERDVIRIGYALPVPINGSWGQLTLSSKSRIKEVLRRHSFDILHLHEPLVPLLSLSILKEGGCKLIGTFHASAKTSPCYWLGRPFLRGYFERLDGRIAVSCAARDFVARYFGGDYQIIPNGVDLERFRGGKVIEAFNDGWINLLFVGRFDRRKGLDYLLKAFGYLKDRFKRVRLIVVGGKMDGAMEKNDIHFVGPKHHDLPDYYKTAHIFCSPATGRESFGIILLEAMAAGLPIVASDIPGYNELIISGREGLLVPPKDPVLLARALTTLIQDNVLRQGMGEAASILSERFSWSRVADSILEYYEEVVSGC